MSLNKGYSFARDQIRINGCNDRALLLDFFRGQFPIYWMVNVFITLGLSLSRRQSNAFSEAENKSVPQPNPIGILDRVLFGKEFSNFSSMGLNYVVYCLGLIILPHQKCKSSRFYLLVYIIKRSNTRVIVPIEKSTVDFFIT